MKVKDQNEENTAKGYKIIRTARNPGRPLFNDYRNHLFDDFSEFHGDRLSGDDRSIITGFGTIGSFRLMIIGQEKGRDTDDKIKRNFGFPYPEGYRKSQRAMKLAEKFTLPLITFIDTPGAFPGIESEKRGMGQAIAENLFLLCDLKVPVINIVIGEGGSGGALAIGIGDRLLMMENAYYSVISPEACASILWKDSKKSDLAADALKLTASDLFQFGIADEIIQEPEGGAHLDQHSAMDSVRNALIRNLTELMKTSYEELLEKRYTKLRNIGFFKESQ